MFRGAVGILGAFLAATLGANPAHAQDRLEPGAQPPTKIAPFTLDAGAHTVMFFGQRCYRLASEVSECTEAAFGLGFHVVPTLHLTPNWSIGLRGAGTFSGGSGNEGTLLTLWQVEGEARYHIVSRSKTDVWLGADAGVVIVAEQVANDELGAPDTLVSTAPIFGLGAGTAFPISKVLRLGPELRGVFIPSTNGVNWLPQRGTSLGTQTGILLAVTGTVDFGA